jgi:hypothetical protein
VVQQMKRPRLTTVAILVVVVGGLGLWSSLPASAKNTTTFGCSGLSGFSKTPLSDQTTQVALALKLTGGICTLSHVATPGSTGTLPASLTINKVIGKLVGRTSCAANATAKNADANAANAYPPSGTLKIVYNQINPATGTPYSSQIYLAIAGYPASNNATPDVIRLQGIVTKGVAQGFEATWNMFMDPVNAKTKLYDPTAYAACTDATAGNASISMLKFGDGTSPNGNTADGLTATPAHVG